MIKAFTVMSASISIKSWCSRKMGDKYTDETDGTEKVRDEKDLSPVMRQYGIGVCDLKVLSGTMYSCIDKARGALMSSHLRSQVNKLAYES